MSQPPLWSQFSGNWRCISCKHFRDTTIDHPATCEAFKQRIPAEIAMGTNLHSEPYPGDNGLQYEPKEGTK